MKSAASLAPGSPVPRPASSGEARNVTSAPMRFAPSGSGEIASGAEVAAVAEVSGRGGGGGGGVIGAGAGPQPPRPVRRVRSARAGRRRAFGVRTARRVYYENAGR